MNPTRFDIWPRSGARFATNRSRHDTRNAQFFTTRASRTDPLRTETIRAPDQRRRDCISLKALPDSIGELRNLRKFDLRNNNLTARPDSPHKLRVRELDLRGNDALGLPPELLAWTWKESRR